jgi:hypothetical protein
MRIQSFRFARRAAVAKSVMCLAWASTVLSIGCATVRPSSADAGEEPLRLDARSEVIRHDELLTARTANLAAALRQLRPRFLGMERASPAIGAIYVNDVYVGPQSVLEHMSVGSVTEVRFIRAIDAKARWGTMCECDGGVILVRTQWGLRP